MVTAAKTCLRWSRRPLQSGPTASRSSAKLLSRKTTRRGSAAASRSTSPVGRRWSWPAVRQETVQKLQALEQPRLDSSVEVMK